MLAAPALLEPDYCEIFDQARWNTTLERHVSVGGQLT